MKLGIRAKIVGIMGVAILIMMFLCTNFYLRELRSQYLKTLNAYAEGIAYSLWDSKDTIYTSQNLSEYTAAFIEKCQQLYQLNLLKSVTHLAILDPKGTIIAHNDSNQIGKTVDDNNVRALLANYKTSSTFDQQHVYHVILPQLYTQQEGTRESIAVVDIGFSNESIEKALQKPKTTAWTILFAFVGSASVLLLLLVEFIVASPLRYLIKIGQRLSEGYPIHSLKLTERFDEIAGLSSVFVQTSDYLQEITDIAQNVATGALAHDVRKRSKRDALGVALQEMLFYLQTLAEIASRIARGDLTATPFLRSDIDAFGRAMRDMTVGLQSLIQQIRVIAEEVSGTGLNLAGLSDNDMKIVQSAQLAVDEMISTMTEMGQSVEEVAHNMDVLSTSVEETSASVSNMTRSISNIAASSSELAEQTQKAIAELHKSTELLKNVTEKTVVSRDLSQETIQDALKGQDSIEEVTASMTTIQQTNSSTVETITRFEQQTQDIGSILDVIDEITDQSSLLALNASIIAAQAGSHGRGFAVIADEMRNLATKVNSSTKDIAAIVKVVQEETKTVVKKIHAGTRDIAQGVKRTEQARQVLQNIFNSAQRSSTVVSDIADAIQKMQETTSRQLRSVMERVNTMTEEIMKATLEQKASTIQIDQTVEHIARMAVQTQHATTEQLQGVRRVLDSVEQVRLLSEQNLQSSVQIEQTADALSEQARILLQSVDRFKLGKSEMLQSISSEPRAIKEISQS
ncbi:methyl-accepting chemotaxis sensory transducer [Candidatus Moduliflexus flocculans]|uniref:Methyl-accepting chemotaxis sensory transducer n=1 Tax=Candidatus Moduliflexus flocculans TaxID=1499966 RepID=A0A0S6VRX4_9BACT|nr:methyl-accepting chemotaxis sensory transducer [Candidatus Moduliflexus flocculans]